MPTITEEKVPAYAHCINFVCPGYAQEEVLGLRTVRSESIGDRGGDGALAMVVENTWLYMSFANPEQRPCPHCGKDREIALDARPTYQNLSGFAQNGLLEVAKFDPNVRNTKADEEQAAQLAAANAAIAEMQQKMIEMAALLEQQNQTDPVPEPEDPEEAA